MSCAGAGARSPGRFWASAWCYFAYHLFVGDRGLLAWMDLTRELRDAKAMLATLDVERGTLERRVGLLQPEHLDPDMLDERARATLNLVGPNEIVIR